MALLFVHKLAVPSRWPRVRCDARDLVTISVRNNEDPAIDRARKSKKAHLYFRMVGIGNIDCHGIAEPGSGLLEGDTMLPSIGSVLGRVPFKEHSEHAGDNVLSEDPEKHSGGALAWR